jgi:hypothetical protein
MATMPGMGPDPYVTQTAAQVQVDNEKALAAAREEFPGWDFHQVFGGWEAVPGQTPVIRGMYLETLLDRLRQQVGASREASTPGPPVE